MGFDALDPLLDGLRVAYLAHADWEKEETWRSGVSSSLMCLSKSFDSRDLNNPPPAPAAFITTRRVQLGWLTHKITFIGEGT